jgi:hypothetical protein
MLARTGGDEFAILPANSTDGPQRRPASSRKRHAGGAVDAVPPVGLGNPGRLRDRHARLARDARGDGRGAGAPRPVRVEARQAVGPDRSLSAACEVDGGAPGVSAWRPSCAARSTTAELALAFQPLVRPCSRGWIAVVRGAGPLDGIAKAASRMISAVGIHPGGGGIGPDRAARPLGAARRGDPGAWRYGTRAAGAEVRRSRSRSTCRRSSCSAIRSRRWSSPPPLAAHGVDGDQRRSADCRADRERAGAPTPTAPPATLQGLKGLGTRPWRWTISAPAIRTSPTCSGCRSTCSRSTAVSSPACWAIAIQGGDRARGAEPRRGARHGDDGGG